tara:strand:+ start:511 stop:756 length:246 start_codon:yes stop_codon:yes gene_type:complete
MSDEYIGEIHTDPTVLDEMAYACFWFESSTLEKELSRQGIPITERIVNDMLERVQDRTHMWSEFYDALDSLLQDLELEEGV